MTAWCLKESLFTRVMNMNSSGRTCSWQGGFGSPIVLWHAGSVGHARYVGPDATGSFSKANGSFYCIVTACTHLALVKQVF